MKVESVSVGRNVGSLQNLLEDRTRKLLALETAWMTYVGNPVSKAALESGYDRDALTRQIIHDEDGRDEGAEQGYNVRMSEDDRVTGASPLMSPSTPAVEDPHELDDPEAPLTGTKHEFEITGKSRPKHRPRILTNEKVDLLDHLARQYRTADEAVKRRRKGRFRPANIAFVTFEEIGSAQVAAQVVHYPQPDSVNTTLAPDPRDIYWGNMLLSNASLQARSILVLGAMLLLLSFWLVPVSALARLLNYDAIKKYMPWLTKILDKRWGTLQVLYKSSELIHSLAALAFGYSYRTPFLRRQLSASTRYCLSFSNGFAFCKASGLVAKSNTVCSRNITSSCSSTSCSSS